MKAALIGLSISESLTPDMHMAEAKVQGFAYEYLRFDTAVAPFGDKPLSALLDMAEAEGFAGVNVTHPFKRDAVALVDELSESAQLLGAVNTILFKDGQRIGHNTDYVGFRSALRNGLSGGQVRKVLLLGAGGAGRATAMALIDQGCQTLCLFDQSQAATEELAKQLQAARPRVSIQCVSELARFDLRSLDGVVNATPMGMVDHPGKALDPQDLGPDCWVADIVYFPRKAELLRAAEAQQLRTMDGSGMAIFQAAAAFHLITGKMASPERMKQSFQNLVSKEQIST
ncbi:shikimate dehydrogenase [Cognatishimia sp. WU-CL00825]|uniref:shikimate dehydrogenase n=1 Tax=Cognatishimia sp. WU-CL00825 TaxID=3127658 RepID=UPI003109BCFC